ncbi:hypothetical protein [Psychroflexus montanilacus]|uniref:hypothetical protein n=1 Tax=Psychroflexus montanilacus TaxID=2873598 RepID=UPI001CCA679C|nr:hypothetical protein [Psychroflexus montanilacus]MBZ9650606.1 hypothetical protein [Psychroflexus montanilacus]
MAKLGGILKIEGTLENMTFYKTKDGHLVRTKGGVSKERIQNDPAFVRTRENGSEFGAAASSGKLLRISVRNLLMRAKDGRVASRLTQAMTKIKNLDTTSARGERKVSIGLNTVEGKEILKGFNFNNKAIIGSVLFAPYAIDTATGQVTLTDLNPMNDIAYPSGATHVSLTSAFAKIDFETGENSIEISPAVNLPIDSTVATQTLVPPAVPAGTGVDVMLLLIEFFQEVNGSQYILKNGSYNVLSILEIA